MFVFVAAAMGLSSSFPWRFTAGRDGGGWCQRECVGNVKLTWSQGLLRGGGGGVSGHPSLA